MNHKEYNGWYNYETWCVNLWLDNDQGTQRDVIDLARAQRVAYKLGDDIKEYVENNWIPDLGATMVADLLNAALSEVNWREIAEHYLADIEDEDDEDETNEDENPSEDELREALTTTDYVNYYYDGKYAFMVDETDSLDAVYQAWGTKNNYFPNVYCISDHGNVHLIKVFPPVG